MQSWIYRVDPELSLIDFKYLFLYASGASQWLGSLSHRERRRFYAAKAQPVFPRHHLDRVEHFVPDSDVDMKSRKITSVHARRKG